MTRDDNGHCSHVGSPQASELVPVEADTAPWYERFPWWRSRRPRCPPVPCVHPLHAVARVSIRCPVTPSMLAALPGCRPTPARRTKPLARDRRTDARPRRRRVGRTQGLGDVVEHHERDAPTSRLVRIEDRTYEVEPPPSDISKRWVADD